MGSNKSKIINRGARKNDSLKSIYYRLLEEGFIVNSLDCLLAALPVFLLRFWFIYFSFGMV